MTPPLNPVLPGAKTLITRLLMVYGRPYWGHLALGFLCMALVAAMSVSSAKLIEPIINDIFLSRNGALLWPITLGIVAVFFIKGISGYGESVIMTYVGQRMIVDIQNDLFARLVTADLAFFHAVPSGDLVSRFTNDVTKLHSAVTGTLTNIGKDGLLFVAFVIFMFYQDALLASIAFFVLPVAIFPLVRMGRRLRKVSTNVQEQSAKLTILLGQTFQGIRLVKAYSMEDYEKNQVATLVGEMFRRVLKASRIKAASHPLMEFLGGCAIAAVVIYGGSNVIDGTKNPGTFFSFITALLMTYEPMKRLANLNANLQEQIAAGTRVFSLIDHKPLLVDKGGARDIPVTAGEITFTDVSFSYSPHGTDILKNITLSLPAGKTAALVGASGAGKSTLMNLIPRFYDVTSGMITIDGTPLSDRTLASLRGSIALVSQDSILFDDTIFANIAYGNLNATKSDIERAAKAAYAHDFILDLPMGYASSVGEQGLRLSGGQRQRIAIARAMVKDAKILLLDEPTSALDSGSEAHIQNALKTLMAGRTTLIIAHRLATVQEAHTIFVMDKGEIVATGSHTDLQKSSPLYAKLCKAQFKGEENHGAV